MEAQNGAVEAHSRAVDWRLSHNGALEANNGAIKDHFLRAHPGAVEGMETHTGAQEGL